MAALREAVIVGAVGVFVGLAANALNPAGLDLTRDYFPRGLTPVTADRPPAATDIDPQVMRRITAAGLQVITHAEAAVVFRDPAYGFGAYVFIDARPEEDFAAGHIPGALNFDHYHDQGHLATVMPVVMAAGTLKVVVYCNGGDCEDSEFAALNLMQRGVPPGRLFVYVGGIEQWRAAGMPLEQG